MRQSSQPVFLLSMVVLSLCIAVPSAQSQGVLFVENNKVGIGIDVPTNLLHVFNGPLGVERADDASSLIRFRTTNATVTQNWLFINQAADGSFDIFDESAGHAPFRIVRGGVGGTFIIRNGMVGIRTVPTATLDVNGPIYQRGAELHADYVFEPDYRLNSIEDHSASMWKAKHLPAIPPRSVDDEGREVLDLGGHRRGMLEELEIAHIYIDQLNKTLQTQRELIDNLGEQVAELQKRLSEVEKRAEK